VTSFIQMMPLDPTGMGLIHHQKAWLAPGLYGCFA